MTTLREHERGGSEEELGCWLKTSRESYSAAELSKWYRAAKPDQEEWEGKFSQAVVC